MLGKKLDQARRQYDAEFKNDVIKKINSGRPVQEISHSLGINSNMVHRWKREYNQSLGALPSPEHVLVIPTVSGAEHERVKARLREVEQERDILKKALGIFSREI